jgi:ribosomal protein L22
MSPDTPGTPDEGTVDDAKVEQEAAAAKAAKKPAAKAKPKAKAKAKAKPKAKAKAKPAAKEAAKKPAAKAKAKPAAKAPAEEAPAKPAPKAKGAPKSRAKAAPKRRRDRDAGELVIVRAHARYVRSSARKARLVCDGIRGKSVDEARAILAFSPRHIAEAWSKLLESAVANAENNHDLDGNELKVSAVFADEGPTIKRFRPRAMGRATKIMKRTSHLTIHLTPKGS